MKIAIIGAGFTGLSAAWDLAEAGHRVVVYEASLAPGGLAGGFKENTWQWSLEYHYHHIFQFDKDIINWLKELGLTQSLFFKRVKTSNYYQGKQFQLDSPISLLRCPVISPIARLRTAATLVFLKLWPFWQVLEKITAQKFLKLTMGNQAWQVLWRPLFVSKFGRFAQDVNAAWFWVRVTARSAKLGYFQGGFSQLAETVVLKLANKDVKFKFQTPVIKIVKEDQKWQVLSAQGTEEFDAVLFTGDAQLLLKLAPNLPKDFVSQITNLFSLSARTLVLELKRHFFKDQTYWLSVNQETWPFLAVVEHTNLASKQNYGGKTLLYIGKYLSSSHPLYQIPKEKLLAEYQPYLDKLSPGFAQNILQVWDFKAEFAQPVVGLNHSRFLPKLITPLPGLYWACMQHVYPHDRGTNYAVKLGRKVANLMTSLF